VAHRFFPVLFAGCFAAALFAAERPKKIFPYDYVQEDLENGLRLITVPTDYPNIVASYIVAHTGSRNEVELGHTGFAHFFEHMMFRGTEKFPPARYNATIRAMGASSNAFTTDDYTCFHTTFSKEDLETVLMMEADRFQNLKYAEPEFKTEALAVLGEYNKNSSNPARKLEEALQETAYDRHAYKHTTMGFLKDIEDMPNQFDYSLKFFDRFYRPEHTTIIVVGDVQPKAVRELVNKYWGSWKHGTFTSEIPQDPAQNGPRQTHVDWPSPTMPLLTVAYKTPAYTDSSRDTAALDAIAYLGFSENSELYEKLVISEQKLDSFQAYEPYNVDPTLFQISARIKKPEDVDYVRNAILETVKSFREKPVDPVKLDAVKKRLRYEAALRMDNSDSIAQILASFIALRRTPETMNALFDEYAQLTPADIQRVAAQYLVESGRTVATLSGPAQGAGKGAAQ
jgi:zinc protease